MVQEKIADQIYKYHRQLKHTDIGIEKNILCIKKKDANEFGIYMENGLKKKSQQRETLSEDKNIIWFKLAICKH